MATDLREDCIFCKILQDKIPSDKIYESDKVLAFADINPLSLGHTLVIPKFHCTKLHEIPVEHLQECIRVAQKIGQATDADAYNLLQNNGKLAGQEVDHAHFHIIPKRTRDEGLRAAWKPVGFSQSDRAAMSEKLRERLAKS